MKTISGAIKNVFFFANGSKSATRKYIIYKGLFYYVIKAKNKLEISDDDA